jgi:hypothetical protein
MLSWPAGPRDTDGIWARHWYKEVETSTSFRPWQPKPESVPAELASVYKACLDHYNELHQYRLGGAG